MINYTSAIDEIFKAFLDAWNAGAAEVVGYVPEIRWPGIEEADKPDASKFWVRVSQQTVTTGQKTLANTTRVFETAGLVFVQMFCPKKTVNALTLGRQLAEVARGAFRNRTLNVWFKNARIQELPPEESAYRFNIVAEYEYDEAIS